MNGGRLHLRRLLRLGLLVVQSHLQVSQAPLQALPFHLHQRKLWEMTGERRHSARGSDKSGMCVVGSPCTSLQAHAHVRARVCVSEVHRRQALQVLMR